jgi:hypothetical protein
VTRLGAEAAGKTGACAVESVVDKCLLPKMDGSEAHCNYFSATGLPDASVTWLQTFSIALTTESGIGM